MVSYENLKTEVEGNGNVLTVTMERLRNAHGAGKLGVNVSRDISNRLAGLGLGHVPTELPSYQEKQVRVYKLGTEVADVIRSAVEPGPEGDAKLKDYAGKNPNQFSLIIEKIRELVTE